MAILTKALVLKGLKVWYHKQQLKSAYLTWRRIVEDSPGGVAITEATSPRATRAKAKGLKHADKLRAMGEPVPKVGCWGET